VWLEKDEEEQEALKQYTVEVADLPNIMEQPFDCLSYHFL
jgi:DNA-directed RNA polymerase subunit H (RpoH/RPB5)